MDRFLTAEDRHLIASYKFKCQEVKDFTLCCLKGTHTGMLLFGAGGNGKSYSIREVFKERGIDEITSEEANMMDADVDDEDSANFIMKHTLAGFGHNHWINHQGRVTPKGLVKQMAKFPESNHLVEDAETMFDDKNCWGVLRQALGTQDDGLHAKRPITWTTSTKDSYNFVFTGSLIIVGNRLLPKDMDEVEAVKTRCPCLDFQVTNLELIAKMKDLCEKGYKAIQGAHLSKEDCYDVLGFMLDAIESDPDIKRDSRGQEKKLNFRILLSGFRFMALGRLEPSINWKALLMSQLKQIIGATKRTRSEKVHDEKQVRAEIAKMKFATEHDKLVAYAKMTGRNLDWASKPMDSEEYKKGRKAAQEDFRRKGK